MFGVGDWVCHIVPSRGLECSLCFSAGLYEQLLTCRSARACFCGFASGFTGYSGLAGLIFGFCSIDWVRDISPRWGSNANTWCIVGLQLRLLMCGLATAALNRPGLMLGEVTGYW